MEQVTFKAALTAEKPQGIREALDIAEHPAGVRAVLLYECAGGIFLRTICNTIWIPVLMGGGWTCCQRRRKGEQLLGAPRRNGYGIRRHLGPRALSVRAGLAGGTGSKEAEDPGAH